MSRRVISPTYFLDSHCTRANISYCYDNALQWSYCESQTYWNEWGMVVVSERAEKELLGAAIELHQMGLEAVDLVVNNDELLDMFYINRDLWPAIRHSWNKKQLDF